MNTPEPSDLKTETPTRVGHQRHSVAALQEWQALGFGMFIHFGLSTFVGAELPSGEDPVSTYCPTHVDVEQWVSVARDIGMKYAVLTTKHVAGHCLWPSEHTDYHVGGGGGDRSDVVGRFVEACRSRGIRPGLYYCLWDNHHRFGSITPSDVAVWLNRTFVPGANNNIPSDEVPDSAFTTEEANDFFLAQIRELATKYGEIFEFWIDIPGIVGRAFRNKLSAEIARLQPQAFIMMNNGFGDGTKYPVDYAWPSDLMAMERWLPNSSAAFNPWRQIEGKDYYLPGEVCDPVGRDWFFTAHDKPRSSEELLGMYLISRARNTNLLLDVGPDPHGCIPKNFVHSLREFRQRLDKISLA